MKVLSLVSYNNTLQVTGDARLQEIERSKRFGVIQIKQRKIDCPWTLGQEKESSLLYPCKSLETIQ